MGLENEWWVCVCVWGVLPSYFPCLVRTGMIAGLVL